MTEKGTRIIFHNKAEIRVQAQIFSGRTLIGTCLADPGQVQTLSDATLPYDIFLKHGATGREILRKLDSVSDNLTLSRVNGRYTIS
jgi:hypothetical protein